MTSSKSFVKFDKVDKSYDGKVLVVKDLNLDINEGEFITMLGPSGSGKTTCLMMLAGFETPTNGEIYLDSKPISRIPPHKRGIGMVFQNYALFPHLTVYENLAFPLKVRKLSKDDIDKKVDKALSMVSLSGFEKRMPNQLSGGQQQRVAVARSLVFDPQLVLMDEPLGALDKNLRESMQYEIKHIHENIGVTVVYVTHDQSEALTMSSRIAVFNDGKVQQLSSPDKLYEEPVNSFVAEFIGENNTFSGQVTDISGGKCKVKLDTGAEIISNPIRVKSKGEKTKVSLRPERAIIDPEENMDNNLDEIGPFDPIADYPEGPAIKEIGPDASNVPLWKPINMTRRSFLRAFVSSGLVIAGSAFIFSHPKMARADARAVDRVVSLNVNGKKRTIEVTPNETLAYSIRYRLGLTGTKIGCNRAECGARTVKSGNKTIYSCSTLTLRARNADITTVEGVTGKDGGLHPVQKAFIEEIGPQCGFCTPGIIMMTADLLRNNKNPSEKEIREYLEGNICRCTGYHNIVKSIQQAASKMVG